jgi:hypothetical protein
MKQVTMQTVQDPQSGSAAARLAEIQQQMFELCVPKSGAPYGEFYKVSTERGFTCITLPTGKN